MLVLKFTGGSGCAPTFGTYRTGRAAARRTACSGTPSARRGRSDPRRRCCAGQRRIRAERRLGELRRRRCRLGHPAPLLKYFTVPAACSASRVSGQKLRRSALKPEAIGLSSRRVTGAVPALVDRVADAERAHHALLGVVEAIGPRRIDDLAEELRHVHALVVVVAVAVVADGDRVRIAAGAHAADDFVVGQAHDGHVARGVAGDERVGAVRRDRDTARLDAHVDGVADRHRRARRQVDDAHACRRWRWSHRRGCRWARSRRSAAPCPPGLRPAIARHRCHRHCARGSPRRWPSGDSRRRRDCRRR